MNSEKHFSSTFSILMTLYQIIKHTLIKILPRIKTMHFIFYFHKYFTVTFGLVHFNGLLEKCLIAQRGATKCHKCHNHSSDRNVIAIIRHIITLR